MSDDDTDGEDGERNIFEDLFIRPTDVFGTNRPGISNYCHAVLGFGRLPDGAHFMACIMKSTTLSFGKERAPYINIASMVALKKPRFRLPGMSDFQMMSILFRAFQALAIYFNQATNKKLIRENIQGGVNLVMWVQVDPSRSKWVLAGPMGPSGISGTDCATDIIKITCFTSFFQPFFFKFVYKIGSSSIYIHYSSPDQSLMKHLISKTSWEEHMGINGNITAMKTL
ncbi:hypothetical protein GQR58_029964 [Nymphon striatum]|nr:hypothetical protein GQR58_029964 [Nymphon striatum]